MQGFFRSLGDVSSSIASSVSASVAHLSDAVNMDAIRQNLANGGASFLTDENDEESSLLEDMNVSYITPRLIAMGFPSTRSSKI